MPNHQSRAKRCFDVIIGSFSLLGWALAPSTSVRAADEVSPIEARAIAKEAYIFGFPMVDGYRNTPTSWTAITSSSKRRGTKSTTYPAFSPPMTK
jgi:hypothetical protein